MSVRNYYHSLRNDPEECSSYLLRGGSRKPCKNLAPWKCEYGSLKVTEMQDETCGWNVWQLRVPFVFMLQPANSDENNSTLWSSLRCKHVSPWTRRPSFYVPTVGKKNLHKDIYSLAAHYWNRKVEKQKTENARYELRFTCTYAGLIGETQFRHAPT
jgi:hypothetical protein